MENVLAALADPPTRDIYLAACFAVMVVPIIAIALWYHAAIDKTPSGRALMKRQNEIGVSRNPVFAVRTLVDALKMGRDIEAGRYGEQPRRMQHQVWVMIGTWVAALVAMFGILIWADAVNRATG